MGTSPATSSRPRWLWPAVAVGAVLLLLVGLGVGLLAGRGGEARPTQTASADGSSSGTAGGSDSACGLAPGSQEVPQKGPEAEWATLDRTVVPTSKTYGPTQIDGPLRTCYAHSPTGALFAAMNIGTALFAPGGDKVLAEQVTDGPLKDSLKDQAGRHDEESSADRAEIRAFSVTANDPDHVEVVVISQPAGASMKRIPLTMVWQDGDWRVDGQAQNQAEAIDSMEGYVPWSAP